MHVLYSFHTKASIRKQCSNSWISSWLVALELLLSFGSSNLGVDLFHDHGVLTDLDGRQYRGAEAIDVYQRQVEMLRRSHPELTVKLIASSVRFRSPEDIAKDLAFVVEAPIWVEKLVDVSGEISQVLRYRRE